MNVDEVGALSHSASCSRMNGEDITVPEMCSITGPEILSGNNRGQVSLKEICYGREPFFLRATGRMY